MLALRSEFLKEGGHWGYNVAEDIVMALVGEREDIIMELVGEGAGVL